MLTKDQALAAMDAQIIRVESERKRRLERRVSRLNFAYPSLRHVPIEERIGLVQTANLYAIRRWTAYLPILLIIGAFAFYLLSEPIFGFRPRVKFPPLLLVFLLSALVKLVLYSHARSYLDGLVASGYQTRTTLNDTTGA